MAQKDFKKIKKVLIIILILNIAVALFKIVLGIIIKSQSITADGFHSVSDGTSNIIGLIGIYFAAKPVDEDHPYGHRKFETIASMFIVSMLIFIAFNVFSSAIIKFFSPSLINVTFESLGIMFLTLIINIFVASYEFKAGKKLSSQFLIADSAHTKSDIFVSIGVIISLILIKLGFPPIIDSIASVVVGFFILHAAYEIFMENVSILTDRVILTEEEVLNVLNEFPVIKNVHNIRSRGDLDHIFLDMHIRVDANISLDEGHRLMHKIEDKFREVLKKNIDVVIHIEPYLYNDGKKEYY